MAGALETPSTVTTEQAELKRNVSELKGKGSGDVGTQLALVEEILEKHHQAMVNHRDLLRVMEVRVAACVDERMMVQSCRALPVRGSPA